MQRKRSSSRKNGRSKKLTIRRKRSSFTQSSTSNTSLSRGVYFDPKAVYRFTRLAPDSILYVDSVLGPTFTDYNGGTPPNYLDIGTAGADFPSGQYLPFSMAFSLANIPDASTITDFFQQYKIEGIELGISLINGVSDTANPRIPNLMTEFDPNDAAIPVSPLEVGESGSTIVADITNKKFTRFIKPKTVGYLFGSTGANPAGFAEPIAAPWIDVSSINVLHYGLKHWIRNLEPNPAANTGTGIRFVLKYFLAARRNQ